MADIAIIGMGCRLPGGLDSISLLWDALLAKVNTADRVPAGRWDIDHYYASNPGAVGKAYVERGNFLRQDPRRMDAAFFDLPPGVAENMDPQQRLMLEVVWEAFENAGLDLPAHAGGSVGVYTGGFMLDHMITHMSVANRSVINQNTAAGMMMTMLSNRVSHVFDFHGPSLSIDTACSSSLTAFNYGYRDVRSGACDIAVVGGVNIMTRPEYPVGMCKGQFLSRDGECKSFDERGDGYGRGEGAGVVLLKRLDRAIEDGDTVLATVLASGVNSDGRTPGISMPSGEAQRKLAEEVCAENGIDPSTIDYVECHGTGTAIGDPTEAGSLGQVYGKGRTGENRVVIGSIKSNIGHTEAVAGVAGVIKAVLTLQHRLATPLGNLKTPNPAIDFDGLGLRLPVEAIPLEAEGRPLRAAVNSFGYGGTNAHVILEETPRRARSGAPRAERPAAAADFPRMLPVSARSPKALAASAARLARMLESAAADLDDILSTASHRRAHLRHRAVAIGEGRDALQAQLAAFGAGEESDVVAGSAVFGAKDAPVFVYTGMGPQWWGMGQQLYRGNALFREALDGADAIFERISGFSILEEMLKSEDESRIGRTEFAQPGNFMVQYGLTKLLGAAGVHPGAVVGHSVGEVTSAWASGILSLEDALTVSRHRSRTQAKTAGTGSMLAVGLAANKLTPLLEAFEGRIDLAAVNGPATLTVAGDTVSIRRLADALSEHGVFNRLLQVEVPYHSHLMDPILPEVREALAGLSPRRATIPIHSTVTGGPVETGYDADYWVENIRGSVAFMPAVTGLLNEGYGTFIEVGPHPVLRSALRDCAKAAGKEIRLVETLRRNEPEAARLHAAVAQTFANGAAIDWSAHNPEAGFAPLPNYPWQREEFWLETPRAEADRVASTDDPLLGIPAVSAGWVWRNDVDHESLHWLRQHVVSGAEVMPAAGYLEILLEAGSRVHDGAPVELREVAIHAPLVIGLDRRVEIVTTADPDSRRATIRSATSGGLASGQLHMSAEIVPVGEAEPARLDLEALRERFGEPVDRDGFYRELALSGLEYGPAFRPVRDLYTDANRGEALARIALGEDNPETGAPYRMHPALLDGCFQSLMAIVEGDETMYLPTGFRTVRMLADTLPREIWCHGRLRSRTAKHIDCDLTLMDGAGAVVAAVQGMRATAGAGKARTLTDKWGDPVKLQAIDFEWRPAPMLAEPRRLGAWLVLRDRHEGFAGKLAARIDGYGAIVHRVASVGEAWADRDEETTIRAGDEADAERLVAEAGPIDGIVLAHGLDATAESADPTGEEAVATMIALSKAIAKRDPAQRPRIYVLTRCAFHCDGGDRTVEPAQRAINGFVRVAHNELEGCNVTSIDLPERLDERVVETAALEVLCDGLEDEVALRGRRRLMSVGVLSDALSAPVTEEAVLSEDTPVRVQPARSPDAEGMIELVPLDLPAPGDDHIRLRLEAMSLPSALLANTGSETLDQPFIALVGAMAEAGPSAGGVSAGERVYGYAPADFASHVQGPRRSFHLAPLPGSVRAEVALDALAGPVAAAVAVEASGLGEGDSALISGVDPMAGKVAEALEARGANVRWLGSTDRPATESDLDRAARETEGGAGFDAIVAPMSDWLARFGAAGVRPGGVLIDTASDAHPVAVPRSVSAIVRTDLASLAGRGRRLREGLAAMARTLTEAEPSGLSLGIGLSAIADQKLELPPVDLRVDVAFDLAGASVPLTVTRPLAFRPDASYLVTGGLGGFGRRTALWLVEHGARSLVLASRSGANTEEKRAFVAGLQERGVMVATPELDLADHDAVERLVAQIEAGEHPLRGIFHAAAVIEDEDLADLDLASYRRVMRSKATSADALNRAVEGIDLDCFVMYSSIANMIGNKRQVPYSVANGFIDGLAAARRAEGRAGMTLNWGAIGDAGVVAEDAATEQFLKYVGIRPIPVDRALGYMGAALQRGVTQLGIVYMSSWSDWARYETVGAQSPRVAELVAADLSESEAGGSEVREELVAQLAELGSSERFDVMAGLIREVLARELRVEPETLSIDRPINELGVDSLMAAEIQMALESNIAVSLSVMDMLGAASVRSVAERTLADFGFGEAIAAE